jgi:DNA polymerase elongation subunit (family B)
MEEKRTKVPVIPNMPLMGQKLGKNDINKFPVNLDFCDKKISPMVDDTIRLNNGILFHNIKMSVEQWNWKFHLVIHGRGEDGRVMVLVVRDVFPIIHIRKPVTMGEEEFMSSLKQTLSEYKMPTKPSIILAKRLVYFELEKMQYAKISCSNLKEYSEIIEKLTTVKNWAVADTKYTKERFYLQCCRQREIASAGFNTFKFMSRGNINYRKFLQNDIDEVFEVSIEDIKPLDVSAMENPRPSLIIPNITDLNFDIETGSRTFDKAVDASREDTHCNIIGMTLRSKGQDLFRVAITTSPYPIKDDGYVIVCCNNELEMFIVFANIIKKLRPAFISGYNIDDFDWRFIVTKLLKYNASSLFFSLIDFVINDFSWFKNKSSDQDKYRFDEYVIRQYMVSRNLKISAEETNCQTYYPNLLSFVNFDEFNQLRKKHPSGKFSIKSLNFFLRQYGLPAKFDMDYPTMHDIYNKQVDIEMGICPVNDEHIKDISDMLTYCIFDTISAQQLSEMSGIFRKIFILAKQNNCTLHDAIHYAPGGLVMENLKNTAFKKGYLDSNERIKNECNVRFPGGLVIHPPYRGMSKAKLTAAERVLHDKEWSDVTKDEVKAIEEAHLINPFDPIDFLMIHHPDICSNTIELVTKMHKEGYETPMVSWDFSSHYPTIMAENNLSPETQIKPGEEEIIKEAGIELRHVDRSFSGIRIQTDFIKNHGGRKDKGLVPSIQFELSEQRTLIKNKLNSAKKILETINQETDYEKYNLQKVLTQMLDMEQLECKIAMNTYYGKFGEMFNPDFYNLSIVADTTMQAQELLLMLISIPTKEGWILQYGDTDSAFMQAPPQKYTDIISQYYGGQIDKRTYYEKMVEKAHELGAAMETHINSEFRKANRPFSTVVKERVGWPKMNIRCKRYALSDHSNPSKSSFRDNGSSKIYEVGIAGKKIKGTSGLFQLVTKTAIDALFNIYNTKSAKEIMTDIIFDIYKRMRNHEIDSALFIKRARYKPHKQNIMVNNFVAKLIARGCTPPRNGENIEFAYVERDDLMFDIYGNKGDGSSSSFMELYTDIVKNKWPFNFMKYMEGEIIGELGQYMCCDPEFIVHPSEDTDAAKHLAEDATSSNGTKFIEMICKKASISMDFKLAKPIYTRIHTKISKHASGVLSDHGIKLSNIKLIETSVKKNRDLFLIFNDKIDKEVNVKKNTIYHSIINRVGEDKINTDYLSLHSSQNSRMSSKNIYINSHSAKHQQNITRLKELSVIIDNFCKNYNEYIVKQDSVIKNSLGLDKRTISIDDIKNASDLFADYKMDDIKFSPPGPELFEECDSLVISIANYDASLYAMDMYKNYISNIVSKYEGGGIIIVNQQNIIDNNNEAINLIKLPPGLNII